MSKILTDYYLQNLGITRWVERVAVESAGCDMPAPDWNSLQQQVAQCTRCDLHRSRTQTVFGVGCRTADLMVVGEAPGYYEDQQGEPFVGRAGQLLTAMLQAIGLTREQVYIANILKCRPPNNRDPQPAEVQQCTAYLTQQIEWIQPRLILAVGRHAAHFLLDSTLSLGKLRGGIHQYAATETPLIVSYHPAYLLRNPADKRKAYADLLQAKAFLAEFTAIR